MDDQLKALMEYTQFHIGMYATLCTLLIGVLKIGRAKIKSYYYWLLGTLILFALAGMFGGLVGSSIPYYETFAEFKASSLGPFRQEWIPAFLCTHMEHLLFWLGIVASILGLLLTRPEQSVSAQPPPGG